MLLGEGGGGNSLGWWMISVASDSDTVSVQM